MTYKPLHTWTDLVKLLNCKKKKEIMTSVSNNIKKKSEGYKFDNIINNLDLMNVYRILPTSGEHIFFTNTHLWNWLYPTL